MYYFFIGIELLESNGWFLLIAIVLCYFLYQKLKPSLLKIKQDREDWKEKERNKKGLLLLFCCRYFSHS